MQCPKGYYCPAGSREPTLCPATMYCTAGVAAGTLCPNGTYNTENGLEESAQCRPCTAGRYCQDGEIKGQCDAGYECNSGANAANDPSKECPRNHYCEAGTSVAVRCESGKIRTTTKATSPSECVDCPAGSYCPETSNGTAIPCPAGFYCVAGVTQPTACGVGKYVATTGSTAEANCTDCPAGSLCNLQGVGLLSEFQCPVGQYCTAGVRTGTNCPAGTYRDTVGATAVTDCAD